MDSFDDTALALTKFGVGQPVSRMEDPTLLRGKGSYTDDQNLPGQAYAAMVRSKIARICAGPKPCFETYSRRTKRILMLTTVLA